MSMFGEWTIVARGLLFKVAIGIIKANVAALFILPIASVYQEQKVWKTPKTKNGQKITKSQVPHLTLWGCFKVYIFNVGWFVLTGTGAIVLFPAYLLGFRTFVEKHASITVERYTGYILVHTFIGPVIVNGKEHLPSSSLSSSASCVYIANHSSQIDAGAILFLWKRWKWIVKRSILFLPGVGWIMALGGHISINRSKRPSNSKKQPLSSTDQKDDKDKDKASTQSSSSSSSRSSSSSGIKYMYEEANRTLKNGNSILVFPQGTRRMTERLPFKDGAFNIAIAAEVPIVPISIEIPLQAWNSLYPFSLLWKKKTDISPVILTVHKPIHVTKQSNKEILKKEAFDIIYSVLPDYTPKEE